MENKEIGLLCDWSTRHSGRHGFAQADKDARSYFVDHVGDSYIREYGFETIAELKTELGCMWSGDECMMEIIKPAAVATMKNKPQNIENNIKIEILNDFIYIF